MNLLLLEDNSEYQEESKQGFHIPKSNRKSGKGSRQRKGRRGGNSGKGNRRGPIRLLRPPLIVQILGLKGTPAMGLPAELIS